MTDIRKAAEMALDWMERYESNNPIFEIISDRGVNATSALENCETSAIGRALANAQ